MGIISTKVDHKTLEECKTFVRSLDEAAVDLADSVDSMYDISVSYLQSLSGMISSLGLEAKQNKDTQAVLVQMEPLQETIKNVSKKKWALLKVMSDFVGGLKRKRDIKSQISTINELAIDRYLGESKGREFVDGSNSDIDTQENQPLAFYLCHRQSHMSTYGTANDNAVNYRGSGNDIPLGSHIESITELNSLLKERVTLTQKLTSVDRRIKSVSEKITKSVQHLESEKTRVESEKKDLETKDQRMLLDLNECKKQNVNLLKENTNLNSRVKMLEDELRPKFETIPVQVYFQRKVDLMTFVEKELLNSLNGQLREMQKEVKLVRRDTFDAIQPEQPLLVLCLHGSRLGTDVGNEIKGFSDLRKTALVVFHHKDTHALPSQMSSGILVGDVFKALGGIFDLGFLKDKGIYQCEMNQGSTKGIAEFVLDAVQKRE